MARNVTATRDGVRSTFLLEVALDRARIKRRFAELLTLERARRGGGDARRFPQPEMARLLGVSLRQYQRWEDEEDGALPYWRNIEEIGRRLDVDVSDLFSEAEQLEPAANGQDRIEALQAQLQVEVDRLRELNDRLEAELNEAELDRPQRERSRRAR